MDDGSQPTTSTIPEPPPPGLISKLAATLGPVQDLLDAIADVASPAWAGARVEEPERWATTLAQAAYDPWAGWLLEHHPDDRPCPGHGAPSATPPCAEGADRCRDCLTLAAAPDILAEVDRILEQAYAARIVAGPPADTAVASAVGVLDGDPGPAAAQAAAGLLAAGGEGGTL